MFNVANKFSIGICAVLALTACGNSDRKAADNLKLDVEEQIKTGNYSEALQLLDTLDTRYASQVEVRRSAMKFRAMAIEALTLRRISVVDDTIAVLNADIERFNREFEYVANPGKGLGGNLVDKSLLKSKADILPRINDEGYFTLSVKIPRTIGFSHLSFFDDSSSASTIPVSSERLVKVENSEMTVLQQEDVVEAIDWLVAHPDADRYVLFGSSSEIKQKLTPEFRQAIVATWQFALAKQAHRLAHIEREKLERKLQQCRNNLANAFDSSTD